jgi:hypothetical protein
MDINGEDNETDESEEWDIKIKCEVHAVKVGYKEMVLKSIKDKAIKEKRQ